MDNWQDATQHIELLLLVPACAAMGLLALRNGIRRVNGHRSAWLGVALSGGLLAMLYALSMIFPIELLLLTVISRSVVLLLVLAVLGREIQDL